MDFPSIALLTDFGERDGFVGVMKGVIYSCLSRPVPLIDISHQIEPQDVRQAMWVLESAYPYFPPETVFLAVVDPGVGTVEQASLIAYWPKARQIFIAPDNGLLTPLLEAAGDELQVYDIRQSQLYREDRLSLHGRSQTFHGRDVYAPVAALAAEAFLAGDVAAFLARFGAPLALDASAPRQLSRQGPTQVKQGDSIYLSGEIIASDRFGNLITNVPNAWALIGERLSVQVGDRDAKLCPYIEAYGASAGNDADRLILVPSSGGTLELAIFLGNAQAALQAQVGEAVRLIRTV